MTHLPEATLRAYLDHALTDAEHAETAAHLTECAVCEQALATLTARAQRVNVRLAALSPMASEAPTPTPTAYARLLSRRSASRKDLFTMFTTLFSKRARPLWVGLSLVLTLIIAFSFAPVRVWGSEFLGLFRVKRISVLPVDITRLGELNDDSTLARRISEMFSDSVTIHREPTPPQTVANAAEAAQVTGFAVRLWKDAPTAPVLTTQSGTAFEIVVNRDRAQAILNEAGRSDLQLPATLAGATIAVDIPAGVSAAYGDCPRADAPEGDAERRIPWSRLRSCVILAQIPSPTVNTPPDVNVQELAEMGLQFMGMTAEEAHSLAQTVDWTSTLVVPLPQNAMEYKEVTVDGVKGYLFYRDPDDGVPARCTLLWVKDGIIYAMSWFDEAERGLAIANALE